MAAAFMVGESLVGEGNEVAHIDLLIGSKSGPVGEAFANSLVNQKEGHTNLLAVVTPNLPCKPDTIISNKVTMKGATQAVQMFGPAQAAVSRAVVDSVRDGHHPRGRRRRPLHHRRRLHPLGSHGRQEDLRLQLPGDQGIDRARAEGRAERERGRRFGRGGAPPVRGRRGGLAGHVGSIRRGRPARRPARCRDRREQRDRPRHRRDVRRRRARRCCSRTARRPSAPARSPTRSRRAAGARSSRRPTSARARRASASSPQARDELGRLDVWVNNAGADVLTGEAAAWDWERKLDALLAVDLKGTIACSYAAGEVMRGQERGGAIVNMSWDHVTTGMAGDDPQLFSAVKGGVLAFSKSLARALAPAVRVNVLCPGWIETELRRAGRSRVPPLGRGGARRWGAGAARRTSRTRRSTSPRPTAAFVTGQAINVNGGVL